MHKRYSVAAAKNQLPAMLHAVEGGETVEITRHGKPIAVVVSFAAFAQLADAKPDLWLAYLTWRERGGGGVPDEVVDGLADPSRGQDPTGRIEW